METIKQFKEKGNECFRAGDYTEALRNYYTSVLYFRSIDPRGTRADDLSEMLLKPKGLVIFS